MEIAIEIRKIIIISIRTCYRSVCSHPFLVGVLFFLILLQKACPLLFSLWLSASPVLVCTAVLLGTLLSFGQPNIPEIEKEERVSHDVSSLRTGVSMNATFVEENETFAVDRHMGKGSDLVEKAMEEASYVDDRKISKVDIDEELAGYAPLINENILDFEFENGEIQKAMDREFHTSELNQRSKVHVENLGVERVLSDGERTIENQHSLLHELKDEIIEQEDNILRDSVYAQKEDHSGLSRDNDYDDEDIEPSDSESDRAESSSPDASMADIIPMLDELHPLLDLNIPQAAHMSIDGSDAASEHDGSTVSDEGTENQGEVEEDGVDDNDDDEEEEEETQGGKDDDSKSAIKWTEDDEKNLMDLGTSELERNLRLENLIARRRARKSFRIMAEKNLIDLESVELPFNVPPISTLRRNPFDLPFDSYENTGLPPIPGSAPSILLPRRNPFDIPYDSNEEKPDLKGDNFEEEFMTHNQKDAFFRRHESFSLGPSNLGGTRHERQDRWRPFFVPERFPSDGTSYSPFQRQSSEISDSKLSSLPDAESISPTEDNDEKKPDEQSDHPESGSEASEDVDSVDVEKAEQRVLRHDVVKITSGYVESHHEMESRSSETGGAETPAVFSTSEIHSRIEQVEKDYSSSSSLSSSSEVSEKISDVKTEDEVTTSEQRDLHSEGSIVASKPSLEESDFEFTSRAVDENQHKDPVYDSSPTAEGKFLSFSSISSDLQEEISEMCMPPSSVIPPILSSDKDFELHSKSILKETSGSEESCAASPRLQAITEDKSGSRVVSEITNHEIIMGMSSGLDTNLDAENESMVCEYVVGYVSINSRSSSADVVATEKGIILEEEFVFHNDPDQNYSSSCEVENLVGVGVHQDDINNSASSNGLGEILNLLAPKEEQCSVVIKHVPEDPQLLTLEADQPQVLETNSGEIPQLEQTKITSSSSLEDDLTKEQNSPAVVEQGPAIHLSSDAERVEESALNKEEIVPLEQDPVRSSSVDVETDTSVLHELDLKILSSGSKDESVPSEVKSMVEPEKLLTWSDKPMVEIASDIHDEPGGADLSITDDANDINIVKDTSGREDRDEVSMAYDFTSMPSESPEYKSPTSEGDLRDEILDGLVYDDHRQVSVQLDNLAEAYGSQFSDKNIIEEDELEEIDEHLLSELDTVGDFNVTEVVAKSFSSDFEAERTHSSISQLEYHPNDSNLTETNLELPVLEAKSLEDINLAFKQLNEGVDVEEVIIPSMVEVEHTIKEEARESEVGSIKHGLVIAESTEVSSSEVPEVASLDVQVVDARTLENIHIDLKQLSESDLGELPKALDLKDGSMVGEATGVGFSEESAKDGSVVAESTEVSYSEESAKDGSVVVAESTEVSYGEESAKERSLIVESTEVGSSQMPKVASSTMQVVDTRSLEDIHIALKQVSESDLGELPKPFDLKDGLVVGEATEVGFSDESAKDGSVIAESTEVSYSEESAKDGSVLVKSTEVGPSEKNAKVGSVLLEAIEMGSSEESEKDGSLVVQSTEVDSSERSAKELSVGVESTEVGSSVKSAEDGLTILEATECSSEETAKDGTVILKATDMGSSEESSSSVVIPAEKQESLTETSQHLNLGNSDAKSKKTKKKRGSKSGSSSSSSSSSSDSD